MSAKLRPPLLALASGLVLGLLPKCPLCLAAYLAALGIGAAGIAAGLLRSLGFALFALGIGFTVLRWTSARP